MDPKDDKRERAGESCGGGAAGGGNAAGGGKAVAARSQLPGPPQWLVLATSWTRTA